MPEGGAGAQAEFALREGPLNGRLLDASGKPRANVDIMMNAGPAASAVPLVNNGLVFSRFGGRGNFDGNGQFSAGWERRPIARTGPDGTFVINDFPWGASRVILRATAGCDRAEFNSPVSAIGSGVTLRLTPQALVTVTGRLVDPKRRAVSKMTCQALHWQSSPRPIWFASAHKVRSDAQGRFRIEGLERGESFSVISNGQNVVQQQAAQTKVAAVRTVALAGKSSVTDFESPRFVAAREGAAQDMGDTMVHPSSTQDEVMQTYGAAQREVVSDGVIETPSQAAVDAAKDALRRFAEARAKVDVRAMQSLTSRLSPDYSPALPEFLARASFVSATGSKGRADSLRPLRFVPRALIRGMLGNDSSGGMGIQRNGIVTLNSSVTDLNSFDGLQVASDTAPQPSLREGDLRSGSAWVVLTEQRKTGLALAAVLHHEDGRWRVVSGAFPANTPFTTLAGFFGGIVPIDGARQAAAAPLPIDQFASARAAGARFLRQWARNRPDAMRQQTSLTSFSFAANAADYRKLQEHRPDQGNCPLNPGDAFALQPIPHMSRWEQQRLTRLVWSHSAPTGGNSAVTQAFAFNGAGPRHVKAVEMPVLLQYALPSGRFVMELVREKGMWKVVEPAMPL